jgi:hypothetical protein
MTPAIVAAFLFGMVAGVFILLAATGMLLAVRDWREAIRQGDDIEGVEMERNRKRGQP